jgi:hypothetical protein
MKRRASPARWLAWGGALVMAALTGAAPAALACGEFLPAASRLLAAPASPAAEGWQLALVPQPAPLAVGRQLALDIVLCPPPGQAPPASLAVDAWMPAHRHGMNYRATLRALGDGRYRAEGLLLHMPGHWQLTFEWPAAAGQAPLRLVHDLTLR